MIFSNTNVIIKLNDGKFNLNTNTIKRYPNSLFAKKLARPDYEANQIVIARGVRQFKLIRQLMVYRDRDRFDELCNADKLELVEDLEYYKLNEFIRWFDSRASADERSQQYCFGDISPSLGCIKKPLMVICIDHKGTRYKNWFKSLNYNKYNVEHAQTATTDVFKMYLYGTDCKLILSLDATWRAPKDIEMLFFTFLLAAERYDFHHKLLVNREDFKAFPEIELPIRPTQT